MSDIVDRDDNTLIEVLIRTSHLEKWEVTREARDRIRDALGGVGIALLDADAIDPGEDPHRARATEDEDDGMIEP